MRGSTQRDRSHVIIQINNTVISVFKKKKSYLVDHASQPSFIVMFIVGVAIFRQRVASSVPPPAASVLSVVAAAAAGGCGDASSAVNEAATQVGGDEPATDHFFVHPSWLLGDDDDHDEEEEEDDHDDGADGADGDNDDDYDIGGDDGADGDDDTVIDVEDAYEVGFEKPQPRVQKVAAGSSSDGQEGETIGVGEHQPVDDDHDTASYMTDEESTASAAAP